MPSILIADASKPSVVMTSEIFKDKFPGIAIHVADSGRGALELLATCQPDLCVVDFDLPDVDGPALIENLRKVFAGPILMTAFPDAIVTEAVQENLFTYSDASNWLSKPVDVSKMCAIIDRFLTERHRIGRRFAADLETQLVGKASGRGKRAPKVEGVIKNISLGGVYIALEGAMKLKKNQEVTMSLNFSPRKDKKKSGKKKVVVPKATIEGNDAKIRAKVAWTANGCAGITFLKLTDVQKKGLMSFLRSCEADDLPML